MPFIETLKLEVRKRAHFRCCICRTVGVEIHHIIPQEEGGPDTFDNAAPLCPTCHDIYGPSATKRKFIREARDFWYELCDKQTGSLGITADDLNQALQPIATKGDLAEIKEQLAKLLDQRTAAASSDVGFPQIVPIERLISSLYEKAYDDERDVYDLFFDSRAWLESGDSYELVDRRAFFIRLFGEETARQLCFSACKKTNFDPDGFTEEEFAETLSLIRVTVMLVTMHWKYNDDEDALECAIGSDGEFIWRVANHPTESNQSQRANCEPSTVTEKNS